MRVLMLAGTILLGAVAAQASSIDVIQSDPTERSIDHVACEACGPYNPYIEEEEPEITLAPGEQRIEIRDVNGEKKVFRTEAWFGGSPVVVVSKAVGQPAESQTADSNGDANVPVTIDKDATTSAVTADMSGAPEPIADKTVAKVFDPNELELRLK